MFQREYDEHTCDLDIDETIVTELLEHDNSRVFSFKILEILLKVFISRFEVWV